MNVISGKVTFGSTGAKVVGIGINFIDLDFTAGSRDATVETNGIFAHGHADANKQFCHTIRDGGSETSQTKAMRAYDAAGNIVLEFNVTGGWGTAFANINVTVADPNYPFELVARSA